MEKRVGEEEEEKETYSKWELVKEICNISSRAAVCAHRHHRGRPPFIDWYLVLRVEKNVTLDAIKKQYHKLALRLHPDKNKHPQAEVAFNLLHQAYQCLFHEATRQEFDLEKRKNECVLCNQQMLSTAKIFNYSTTRFSTLSSKEVCSVNFLKAKLFEEILVIENCLFKKSSTKGELPVFNPSDYLSQGYPHYRSGICRRTKNRSRFQTENIDDCRRKFESPVFEFQ